MSGMKRRTYFRGPVVGGDLTPGGGALFCSCHGARGIVLMRLSFLSALAEARGCYVIRIIIFIITKFE